MDLTEVVVGTPIVGRQGYVAVPDAGFLKVPHPAGQSFAARALVHLDVQVDSWDLEGRQISAAVIEIAGHLREAGG